MTTATIHQRTVHQRSFGLEIVEVIQETPDAVSLVFDVPDDLVDRFRYLPGQFLTLQVPSEVTGSVARCYSLSSCPHLDDTLIVTVKRTAGGYASNWICDNAAAGMTMTVLPPSGVFSPKTLRRDLLLCAGGSGITPLISIAKSALVAGTGQVVLLYANRNEASVIFQPEIADMLTEFPDRFGVVHWLEADRGLPTATDLTQLLRPYAAYQAYLCGPAPFMDAAADALHAIGVHNDHIHREIYQSLTTDPFADIVIDVGSGDGAPSQAIVEMDGQEHVFDWPRNIVLLDLLLANGIEAPYSCREGTCSSCACTVVDGDVTLLANEALVEDDLAEGMILACQAVPVTDVVNVVFDL